MSIDKNYILELIKKEGDYHEFEYQDIKCVIRRNKSMGNLCGYVYIPPEINDVHGKDYTEIYNINCHGGLTYSNNSECGDYWIIGFDCAHHNDLCPRFMELFDINSDIYRDMNFVKSNLMEIVDQLDKKNLQLKKLRKSKIKKILDD